MRLIRAEAIKLRTTWTPIILVLSAIVIVLLIVGLTVAFADVSDLTDERDVAVLIVTPMVLVGLLLGVVGALTITSEHAHGTIKVTFAAAPRRSRVLLAKTVVLAALAVVVAAALLAVSAVGALVVIDVRGGSYSLLGDPGQRDALIGAVLLVLILTLLGYGLGLLMRSSPAAIVTLILWPLLIENLVGGLLFALGFEGAVRWLPYQAGFSLLQVGAPEEQVVNRWVGGAVFGGVTLLVLAIGWVLTLRRDA